MKVLVATKDLQGKRKNDFSFVPDGELVRMGFTCDGARADDKCGCARSMSGMQSHKGTTTVKVVEMEVDLEAALAKSMAEAGYGADPKHVQREAAQLKRIADTFPVGAVLEIRGRKIQTRV